MKILVLYESCTGNTAFGVEAIRRALTADGHDCSVRRFREASPVELSGHELYVFASPLNSFAPLATVWRWMKLMPAAPGAAACIFMTGNGWLGVAHRLMARELRRHGMVVLGHHLMRSADNWPISRHLTRHVDRLHPMKHKVKTTVRWARRMAEAAAGLESAAAVKLPALRLWPTPTLPMALFALAGGLRWGLGRRSLDEDSCDLCGRCRDACPAGAVTMSSRGPVFARSCIGCWACFNVCPNQAIRSNIPMAKPPMFYGGYRDPEEVLRRAGLPPR